MKKKKNNNDKISPRESKLSSSVQSARGPKCGLSTL